MTIDRHTSVTEREAIHPGKAAASLRHLVEAVQQRTCRSRVLLVACGCGLAESYLSGSAGITWLAATAAGCAATTFPIKAAPRHHLDGLPQFNPLDLWITLLYRLICK